MSHHGQSSNLSDSQVESTQVQWLLPDCGQVWNRSPPLLHEGQVTVHPQPPLGFGAHVVEPGDLLIGHGGHTGLLERTRHGVNSQC